MVKKNLSIGTQGLTLQSCIHPQIPLLNDICDIIAICTNPDCWELLSQLLLPPPQMKDENTNTHVSPMTQIEKYNYFGDVTFTVVSQLSFQKKSDACLGQ